MQKICTTRTVRPSLLEQRIPQNYGTRCSHQLLLKVALVHAYIVILGPTVEHVAKYNQKGINQSRYQNLGPRSQKKETPKHKEKWNKLEMHTKSQLQLDSQLDSVEQRTTRTMHVAVVISGSSADSKPSRT